MENVFVKISLEPHKTRLPLIFPSIIDGKVNYVSSGSTLEDRKNGNYGGIPLNLEPKIVGYLNKFTPEMAEKYGNYEKVFSYSEILEMFTFFQKYYSYLYSNESVYEDMQEYVNSVRVTTEGEKESLLEMDKTFKEYGGNKFYKWLIDYYFGMIDFHMEYCNYHDISIGETPLKWIKCVEKLPSVLYYVDACEFYHRIVQMHDKFKDIDNISKCASIEACCECAEYFSYGGNELYDILSAWMERMANNLEYLKNVSNNEVANISLSVNFKKKIEDFGNFHIFSKEFIAGEEYNIGNVCTYNNEVYVLIDGKGFKIDESTGIPIFDPTCWEKYITCYNRKNKDYGIELDNISDDYIISGRTSSILEEFQSYSMDVMSNPLPGIYDNSNLAGCPHPSENTVIQLPYKIGEVINMERIDDTHYKGDILYCAHFYPCDANGNEIGSVKFSTYANENMMESINQAIENAHELEYWDEIVGVDFEYYKGAILAYAYGAFEVTKKNGKPLGVKCIDKCRLELKNTLYYLSANDSYPIQYYDINYDLETRKDNTYGKDVTCKMCDFYIYPKCYEGNYNNLIAAPIFRKDESLGFSGPEKVTDNIYIDRGYATVIDRHLKVCEVNSLDELITYGNGSFEVIDIESQGES